VWTAPSLEGGVVKAFLSGRRSVRRYRSERIPQETIREVLSVGAYAPTASNAQDVSAAVFTDTTVFRFATLVNNYYAWFAGLLRHRALFPLLWFTAARPYLKNNSKLLSIKKRVSDFGSDHDWVFFGAPVVIVLSAPRKHKDFGRVNCVIAAERMMQYASALGLGSCYIGFAEVALRRRPQIAREMGLSGEREPLVVFTLGQPAVRYHRLPARHPLPITNFP
jgi:nitroreductase